MRRTAMGRAGLNWIMVSGVAFGIGLGAACSVGQVLKDGPDGPAKMEMVREAAPTRADVAREYLRVDRAFTNWVHASRDAIDDAKLREFNIRFDHVTTLFFQARMREAVAELRSLYKAIESRAKKENDVVARESTWFCDGFYVEASDSPVASPNASCPNAEKEREELLKRLNAIAPVSEAHRVMIEIAKARAALITEQPDFSNSESFLQRWNCDGLGQRVARTVDGLEQGMLRGYTTSQSYWPLIVPDAPPIAMRKPERPQEQMEDAARDAEIEKTGRPVVIALHGAGGDETIFEYAYGVGRLIRDAHDRDATIVMPRTEFFGFYPDALPRLLDQLELFSKIDRSRVYLIGHSMGAQAALGIARKHPDLVRGIVLIGGGIGLAPQGKGKPEKLPPVLMIGGELDPIFPAKRLEHEARIAKEAGLNVEFRIKKNYGHVFVVNGALDETLVWLETQGLPSSRMVGK